MQRAVSSLALAALLLIGSAATAAPPADPVAQELETRSAEALRLASSPQGAAALYHLAALSHEVPDLSRLVRALSAIANRPSADDLNRDLARQLLMEVEQRRGRLPRVKTLAQDLGVLSDFWVIGGFDNEGKAGCDQDFGPEAEGLSLAEQLVGARGQPLTWRRSSLTTPDGYVDFSALLRPANESVGYALTFLESPKDTPVVLSVGTSGGFRLWVNGALAASSDRYNTPHPDQHRVEVPLRKGLNRVLLKVCQEEGPFGFYLRHARAGRGAFPLAAVLPDEVPPLPSGRQGKAKPLPTRASLLADAVKKRPSDARLRADWATVMANDGSYDRAEHTARLEADRAAEAAPKDAEIQLVAARAHDEDRNARRTYLEAALRAEPENSTAAVMLAHLELVQGHPERALPMLETLLERHPKLAIAHVLRARTFNALGEDARASRAIESALDALPRAHAVITEGAHEALRRGKLERAKALLRLGLALHYDQAGNRLMLSRVLADTGEVDEALRELQHQLVLTPFNLGLRIQLAELQLANGRVEEGLSTFAAARALSPDDAGVPEHEGRALLALGRQEEALAALERSLDLRPQNPALREVVNALRGQGAGMGEAHAIEVGPLIPEAEAYRNEDYVYLVDNTFVRVQPSGQSSRFHQLAIKIQNTRGVDAARSFPITYAPGRQEVRILRARITKPDGSVIEAFNEGERQLNEPWSGMYYDARAKVLSFPALAVGDVLELRYRLDDVAAENLLSDYWGDVMPVQRAAPKVRFLYQVEMPKGRPLYSNASEIPGVSHTTEALEDGRTLYTWRASTVAQVLAEPSMPGWAEVASTLHVSTYKSWDEVGRYYWGLIRDQLTPTDEVKAAVREVLKNVNPKDEAAIVSAIYDFVVTHTRYVALEFGIHGFKPYRVDRVLSRRFGDCKDKASLIHAMLRVAGVDSRIVLLRMRNLGSLSGTPASLAAFNHAIVYVPGQELWLDGTAEFHGAHELPGSDRLANVLVVEPGGKSRFMTIPAVDAGANVSSLTVDVNLDKDGTAAISGSQSVKGQTAPRFRSAYRAEQSRASTFERGWARNFPGVSVKSVKVSDTTDLSAPVSLDFELTVPRLARTEGSVLRVYPFGARRAYIQSLAPLSERRHDLVLSMPWTERTTWRFDLPAGTGAKALPKPVKLQTPFGALTMSFTEKDGQLVAESELSLTVARVKAEDYAAFRAFLTQVDQAFDRRIELVPGAKQARSGAAASGKAPAKTSSASR